MNLAALDVGRDDDIFTGPAVQTGFTMAPTNVSTFTSVLIETLKEYLHYLRGTRTNISKHVR